MNSWKEIHKDNMIVTVCDEETWGDYDHATVIIYPSEQQDMLDTDGRIPRDEDEFEYEEYDLEEYIQMRIDQWIEETM